MTLSFLTGRLWWPHADRNRQHLDPNRDRVLGHRVREVPLPRGLHQGHRRQGLDREDQEGVLNNQVSLNNITIFVSKDRNYDHVHFL